MAFSHVIDKLVYLEYVQRHRSQLQAIPSVFCISRSAILPVHRKLYKCVQRRYRFQSVPFFVIGFGHWHIWRHKKFEKGEFGL
jgi:hypothetical protein